MPKQKQDQKEVLSFSPPIRNSVDTAERAINPDLVGTWEWDPTLPSSLLSPELYRLFGTEPSDPGHVQKWFERVHAADREKVQQAMQEGAKTGNMDFEYRYQNPELGMRWF